MASPIAETPVLKGKEARKFLKDVEENLKKDHTAEFLRAKIVMTDALRLGDHLKE